MRRTLLRSTVLASMVAAALAAPAAASASDGVPPNCYKHPITGEILCPHPPAN